MAFIWIDVATYPHVCGIGVSVDTFGQDLREVTHL